MAYSEVDNPAETFGDLLKLSADTRVASPFNVEQAGEPRLLEFPGDRAKVYVCDPGVPVESETPWVIYRIPNGVWWLALD